MAEVQLSEISKKYGTRNILSNLDLTCESGEYVVLLGPSGCGKTTLLRIIAGLETPDAGDVRFAGSIVNKVPPRKRNVAYVFQHDGLYPHLTVRKSILLGLKQVPPNERDQRIDQASEMTGAKTLLDRYPDNLSGGELRRAAITKAITKTSSSQSSVRLLDEPLSALDAHVRHSIQDSLLDWHSRTPGVTMHVTHDGQEAMRVADRIGVLDNGKIVQFESPERIFCHPISKTVALSLGSLPMSFVPAVAQNGKLQFDGSNVQPVGEPSVGNSPNIELDIGIRYHSIKCDANDNHSQAGIKMTGKVVRLQTLDGKQVSTVNIGNARVLVETNQAKLGDELRLFASESELHFFDKESGQRYE